MIDADDAMRVLRLFGNVEWARLSLNRDLVDSRLRPPLIVWRFELVERETETFFADTVASFSGRTSWVFDPSGRNWVIEPKRLADLFESRTSQQFSEVMVEIKTSDQDFCAKANLDAAELFRDLEYGEGSQRVRSRY